MSAKLSITVNGKRQELDAAEARRILDELKAFFGEGNPVVFINQPAPIIIERAPLPQPNFPQPWYCGDSPTMPAFTCQSRS